MSKEEIKETKNTGELTVKYSIDGNEIKLTPKIVQEYIVGNSDVHITMQEFKLFTELCKVRKLNPFLNEAYLIKYSDSIPAQLVVGKDAILKRAVLNPNYDGMESGVILLNKETQEIIERPGTFVPATFELVGGWAKVYVKNRTHPSYTSVNLSEVAQTKKDGTLNSNWAGKPATMVEKVAKVRALREAFVEDLAGMYEAEEFKEDETFTKTHGTDKMVVEQKEETTEDKETENEVNINEI